MSQSMHLTMCASNSSEMTVTVTTEECERMKKKKRKAKNIRKDDVTKQTMGKYTNRKPTEWLINMWFYFVCVDYRLHLW